MAVFIKLSLGIFLFSFREELPNNNNKFVYNANEKFSNSSKFNLETISNLRAKLTHEQKICFILLVIRIHLLVMYL